MIDIPLIQLSRVITCLHARQAPCCGKLYVCRLCHDAEENHQMDRFKVKEVQCSDCQTVQQVIEKQVQLVCFSFTVSWSRTTQ